MGRGAAPNSHHGDRERDARLVCRRRPVPGPGRRPCVTRGRSPPRAPICSTSARSPRGRGRRRCRQPRSARAWSRSWSGSSTIRRARCRWTRRSRRSPRPRSALGAHMVNDVTGLADGPAAGRGVRGARRRARGHAHAAGRPARCRLDPRYDDLLGEVRAGLETAVAAAEAAGMPPEAVCVDPGIGFGKTVGAQSHPAQAARRVPGDRQAASWSGRRGRASSGRCSDDLPPAERLEGTLAACVMAVAAGAHIVRVHDVAAVRRAVRVAEAIRDAVPD